MEPSSSDFRDISQLQRSDLLDDYLRIAKGRGDALVATALRTRSVSMRDILVHGALQTPMTSEDLKKCVLSDAIDHLQIKDAHLLGDLGRLVILQNILEHDDVYGEKLLSYAHKIHPGEQLSRETRRAFIQYHVALQNSGMAEALLDQSPDIDSEFAGYLRAELYNPFVVANSEEPDKWLKSFNALFEDHNLASVSFKKLDATPFDRLTAEADAKSRGISVDAPLVSVVLTSYRPRESELHSSVLSILNQTWANLELIVVDDCSGAEYKDIFDRVCAIDPRVKLVNSPENRGTYVARNLGYAEARGAYITGQDDDDWSHPERITRQVEFLENNATFIACRVTAVRCDENLGRCRRGFKPVVLNPSSLMLRREGYESVGGYLESRKGADSEYYFRLKSVTGGKVGNLKEPLSVIRILSDSLSRGDFSPGWRHPARSSFRSAYRYWHRHTPPRLLQKQTDTAPPVRIPQRYSVSPLSKRPVQFDVVFAGDWQRYGGPQKSMIEEIRALQRGGMSVGVMNLEAARFMHDGPSKPLNDKIQDLINEGFVDEVFYDDDVEVRLLILRYPPILQFFTHEETTLNVQAMLILANQAPSELDGRDIRYLVEDCNINAERAFGVTPRWVPQGPQVRDYLELYLTTPRLADFNMPGILDLDEWWRVRLWYRSTVPVVGRHSRDDVMKWPAEKDVLTDIYRTDGEYDVRFMGGQSVPLRVLNAKTAPAAWTVYKKDELPVADFLYSLDYFVFYQHPRAVEAFGRAILEALASGTVVILPKHFEKVFGKAALYAETEQIRAKIFELHSDFSKYQKQLQRSRKILEEQFSYSAYIKLVSKVLAENRQ